jgi:CBS domain-containing protein
MLVREIMTKKVVTINPNNNVFEACLKYRDKKVGCLVVVDNEICVEIITERDLIERAICNHKNLTKTKVIEIMSSPIKTVNALDNLEKALEKMKSCHIKKLPVIMDERIVGIITVTDISKAKSDISKRFVDSWIKPRWED